MFGGSNRCFYTQFACFIVSPLCSLPPTHRNEQKLKRLLCNKNWTIYKSTWFLTAVALHHMQATLLPDWRINFDFACEKFGECMFFLVFISSMLSLSLFLMSALNNARWTDLIELICFKQTFILCTFVPNIIESATGQIECRASVLFYSFIILNYQL